MYPLIPERLKEPFRPLLRKEHPAGLAFSQRRLLKATARYRPTATQLFGRPLQIVDSASFLSSHAEIFERQLYRFQSASAQPVIVDVGANIGLAAIYWHRQFPEARITAVECDEMICKVLGENLTAFGVRADVIHGAAWDSRGELRFAADHADAGRVCATGGIVVQGILVSDLLREPVIDLLKLDIEGAELRVLRECESELHRVQRIFVEFHSSVAESQQLSEILSILERQRFRYYIEQTGVMSPHPLCERTVEAGFDLQLNIFATRIRT